MTIRKNDNGSLLLNQGDSGYIRIVGLDNTQIYDVYFAFTTRERQTVGEELKVHVEHQDFAKIFIPVELTEKLIVPDNRMQEIYYYGVKISRVDDEGNVIEDTVLPDVGKQRTVIVSPKWVEGPIE